MKKNTLIFLALLFVCPFLSIAQKVKKEEASDLAKIVFKKYNSGRLMNTKEIIPLGSSTKTDTEEADTLLYIVPFENGGYAIISGDKGVPPYLGYCPKGDFQETDLPPGLDYLLGKYKSKILKIKNDRNPQDEDIKKRWEEIYDQNQLKSVMSNVAPMLDTEWGQQRGFNDSIPNNYAAGCTAVAMAQILRYWECRVNPTGNLTWVWNGLVSHANFGTTTYRWLDMNDDGSDTYNAQLIYHAGVSCLTKYNYNGSSSTPGRARDGFVDYWGMDNDADVKWRIWHLRNWKDMLLDELHANRPILYSAGGAEIGGDWVYGHSWVIDGVTVDHDYFWCNWGWYGNHNGWYELGDFNPDGDNYNQMESAIFNVYPAQPSGVATPQLANQSFTYNSNGYTIAVPEAFGATSYEWITNNGAISGSGISATLYTDESATVQVRAYNEICEIYSPYKAATITINYGPITGPTTVCTSNTTFTLNNLPVGCTVSWTRSTNLTYVSGQGTASYTVKAASSTVNGAGRVQATISGPCGDLEVDPYDVWVGTPPSARPTVQLNLGFSSVCKGETHLATVSPQAGITDYQWQLIYPDGFSWNLPSGSSSTTFCINSTGGPYRMGVKQRTDGCSWSQEVTTSFYVEDCGTGGTCGGGGLVPRLIVSPNPTSYEVTIAEVEPANDHIPWVLRLMSPQGAEMVNVTTTLPKTINVQGLHPGVYLLHARRGEYVEQLRLVVE